MATKTKKEQTGKTSRGKAVEAFRGREDKELRFEAEKLRKEMFELKFKAASEGIQNPSKLGQIRKQIARIATVLSERTHGIRGQFSR